MPRARILELLAAAPDEPVVTINLEPADLPPDFHVGVWVNRELPTVVPAIVEAVTERTAILIVNVKFPNATVPLQIPIVRQQTN